VAYTWLTAHSWPWLEPEWGRVPDFTLGSSSLGRPGGQRAWVAEQQGRVVGLAVAHSRAGGLVWDVVHLHAQPDEEIVAGDLLEQGGAGAGDHRARRGVLGTPPGKPGPDPPRPAGVGRVHAQQAVVVAPRVQGEGPE